jgi:hypothetical protein
MVMFIPLAPPSCTSAFQESSAIISSRLDYFQAAQAFSTKRGRNAFRAEFDFAHSIVDDIEGLQTDWDGYGALQVSHQTATNTRRALDVILNTVPLPEITPNPNGTISLEWESSEGIAHLEIGKTQFSAFIRPSSGPSTYLDGSTDAMDYVIGPYISAILFPHTNSASTINDIQFVADNDRTLA